MRYISDFHVHGKYSRACSKELTIDNLEKYARIKGVDILGTGDFSHPGWRAHIAEKLEEDSTGSRDGILRTKTGFPFVLSTEYSFIYSQGGKGRRVHHVVLAPSLDVADQITETMKRHGRVDYDGRPIFGISSIEFTEEVMAIDKDIEIIPAHIWTPWFGALGSNSGFDSIKECFGDQVRHIHAIETGLSSDPPMNWRLSQLDRFQIVSFSDLHSYWPWRIGREATVFDIAEDQLGYKKIIEAIRTGNGLAETIEVDPSYGKYHFDGHRKCGVVMGPSESRRHNNICPVCRKPLTVGVLQRVEELADRPEGYMPKDRPGFRSLIPLHDIISIIIGKGVATKATWQEYNRLLKLGKSENDVMLNISRDELLKSTDPQIADAIMLNREGRIKVRPGYDGVYGEPILMPQSGHATRTTDGRHEAGLGQQDAEPKKHEVQRPLKRVQTGLSDFI
ncbi:DNA helicase UvrD [Candidatus Woesearchaeota archaeon]|nr:DNA helicase UvrD [Candidatus Woesearchaeota archaeon]